MEPIKKNRRDKIISRAPTLVKDALESYMTVSDVLQLICNITNEQTVNVNKVLSYAEDAFNKIFDGENDREEKVDELLQRLKDKLQEIEPIVFPKIITESEWEELERTGNVDKNAVYLIGRKL